LACGLCQAAVRASSLNTGLNAGGRGVGTQRPTLGRYGVLTPEQARRAAQEVLARVRLGEDPQAEKSRQRACLTVGGLVDAFNVEHVSQKCKLQTAKAHKIALARLRAAHGNMK